MHPEQQIFCLNVKLKFFREYKPFRDARVLDCGSLDINGNNRFLFQNCQYTGVDIHAGPNVDVIMPIHKLTYPDSSFDTVICTEVLEHDEYWPDSIANMIRMLKPGGLLIITCAGPERGPHSMFREGPVMDGEYYGNLCEYDFRDFVRLKDVFADYAFTVGRGAKDLYFWGIKAEEGSDDSKRE